MWGVRGRTSFQAFDYENTTVLNKVGSHVHLVQALAGLTAFWVIKSSSRSLWGAIS